MLPAALLAYSRWSSGGGGGLSPAPTCLWMTVTAAASVPSSSTLTYTLCRTSPTPPGSGSVHMRLVPPGSKGRTTPSAHSASFREQLDSAVNLHGGGLGMTQKSQEQTPCAGQKRQEQTPCPACKCCRGSICCLVLCAGCANQISRPQGRKRSRGDAIAGSCAAPAASRPCL